MNMRTIAAANVWILLAATAVAQAATITEERVREAVSWLAADERAGRDTGSPQLEAAGDWLAARFAAAGLQQVVPDSWFHEFTLPGRRIDSRDVVLKLQRTVGGKDAVEVTLVADTDVRLLRPADVLTGEGKPCDVFAAGDPAVGRLLMMPAARRPIVLEVAEDNPDWRRSAGEHGVLGGVRAASQPLFLVRSGALPAAPTTAGGGEIAWTATWSLKEPQPGEVTQRNVVAMLPGTDKKDEFVVVSAHYDHIGVGREVAGDAIYNGADDDATGTTGVMLLAEALAKTPPCRRSIVFVCFAAEERGLKGSAAFCAKPPLPLAKVAANLNLEMLGRPEPGNEGKAWITGAGYSDFAAIVGEALHKGGVDVIEFDMADRLFAASDNWSFAREGVVAHSLSAGSLHKDYHQPSDEVAKLDIPHMTKVVHALFEVVRTLADRDAAPAWSDAGKQRLQRRR